MAHLGFKKLSSMLAAKGIKNPGGLAHNIGVKKYGKKLMSLHKKLKESQAKKK